MPDAWNSEKTTDKYPSSKLTRSSIKIKIKTKIEIEIDIEIKIKIERVNAIK